MPLSLSQLTPQAEVVLEMEVLQKFSQHKNIARFFGAFYQQPTHATGNEKPTRKLWLALEYCAFGSAADLVEALHHPPKSPDGEMRLVAL